MEAMLQRAFMRAQKTLKPEGFELSAVEIERAEVFRRLHGSKLGRHRHMANPRFTYALTPTGLGTKVIIRCKCGVEKDITEYESW